MSKIEVLPDNVANQIAAGEVIARPSSCVKELLENSIDAGSCNIVITIENAGKKLIELKDDGAGMDEEDLNMAFLRHATSKIRSIDDLNYIETLGFRGEALASIAAVSRVDALTRPENAEAGSFISIEGGRIKRKSKKASNKGTIISAKDLFYNTPARLKFLKSNYTEEAHIIETATNEGLAKDNLSIRLIIDSKEVLFFPRDAGLKERIRIIHGREVSDSLMEIGGYTDNVKITGYISKPSVTKSTRNGQYLFVNKRPVINRSLTYAVYEGFGTLLMKGRYPFTYIFIDINPSLVDVNVHPTKSEVKFKDERFVYSLIKNAVADALSKNELTPEISAEGAFPSGDPGKTGDGIKESVKDSIKEFFANETPALFEDRSVYMKKNPGISTEKPGARPYLWMKALGQVHRTYIVGEDDGNLVLIDQHAAHEKSLYEKIMAGIAGNKLKVQELLIPEVIEVSPAEKRVIENRKEVFNKLGFFIEEFGEKEFKISAHPVLIKQKAAAPFVREMIELLMEKEKADENDVLRSLTATMACRAAVKAGDELNDPEIEELLNSFYSLKDPHSCPHGRPPIIKISFNEIEKMFKRKL